jgi:hypothetical protein
METNHMTDLLVAWRIILNKMNLKDTAYGGVNWIDWLWIRDQWWDLVNTVMNHIVYKIWGTS